MLDAKHSMDEMVDALNATGKFHVLERLHPRSRTEAGHAASVRTGIIVDIETTGPDPKRHEVIEVSAIPFSFTANGNLLDARAAYRELRKPAFPISDALMQATGITNQDLRGLEIPAEQLDGFIGDASVVIAHGAANKRLFLEQLCERFACLPWACCETQVPWLEEGFASAELRDILQGHGKFYETNRAFKRCEALIEIVALPLPKSGMSTLGALLNAVRRPTFRIWALGASATTRDLLISSGYTWNDGNDGRARAFSKEVAAERIQAEQEFLESFWFDGLVDARVQTIDAVDRFSERS